MLKVFLQALIPFFFAPIFFPSIRLFAFAPFFAYIYLRKPYLMSLWISALVGLLADLMNHSLPFGVFTLSYTILGSVVYFYRRRYYGDGLFSLSLYTLFISMLYAPIQILVLRFFHIPLSLSISDLIFAPTIDSVYAFFWFTCPHLLYNRRYEPYRSR